MKQGALVPIVLLLSLATRLSAQETELRFDRLAPAMFEPYVQGILDSATRSMKRLLAQQGQRTVANTLRPYDDIRMLVNRALVVSFIRSVHPDPAVRAAAGRAEALRVRYNQTRRGDRSIFDMLAAVDTSGADAEVRYWLRRELDVYRSDAVNRDSSTRVRVTELQREVNRLEQRWAENARVDTITIAFDSGALAGMNAAWFAARKRGPGGAILVSAPELSNVALQASSRATRERAFTAHLRPRPNHFVLDTLLRARHALARALGSRSWAEEQLRGSMAGSPQQARRFLDEVRRVTEPALRRDIEAQLGPRTGRSGDGTRPTISAVDLLFQSEAVIGVEPEYTDARLRPYLPYTRVRDGMLDLARELFDVDFRPAAELPVWHPTVEPYRVFRDGRLIAQVYLDLHARLGRPPGPAFVMGIRQGVRDRTIGETGLVGSLVSAQPGEPALLQPIQMETLFHEFGHLLADIFSARPWYLSSGAPSDFDFREVPSVLFSEWAKDPAVVGRFARHYENGQPPPQELLATVRRVEREGSFWGQAMARTSLELHDREPGDMHAVTRQAFADAVPPGLPFTVRFPDGDLHPEAVVFHFGNADAAAYYTYLWSSVIARDLLTRFDRGLLDSAATHAYRLHILEAGNSRPVTESIERFLGRPFSLDAWARARTQR